jgi:pyruvate,water dikinase
MNILWLGDPLCSNQEFTGGKAANLSLLAEHFPVPPGFCITTDAFKQTMASGLDLDQPSHHREDFPKSLLDEITSAYQRLDAQSETKPLRVAVRSSAADEDGSDASFAGQHETILNVVGVDELFEAIRSCWASAFSKQALAYRQNHGQQSAQIHMGVLVQQLVPADASFVLFSVNPLNHNVDEMMINASWGLGESVVSGSVTPDVFVLDKASGNVINQTISLKTEMTVQADKNTKSVKVPRFLQKSACLNDNQIKQAAELGKTLEEKMKWPVDIEGAFHSDRLYLLQCRPITTLNKKEPSS